MNAEAAPIEAASLEAAGSRPAASAPPRGGSLRGAGPRRSSDFLKAAGFVDVPTAEPGSMRPGALRGSAQGRDLDSLAHTLFLRIYPVIAVVVLVTQIGIAWVNYRDQLHLYTERADLMASLTAKAIAGPDWSASPQVYRRPMEALTLDPAFRAATLRDATGNVVMTLGEVRRGRSFEEITARADLAGAPGGAPVGRLTLSISAEALRGNAEKQAVLAVVTSLILMFAFVLTLHANVRRHVLGPLKRLLLAMREVEHKRWVPVELDGAFRASNEIDVISQAFNRMVDGLRSGDEAKHLLQQLEQAHRKLEDANHLVMESIGYARRIQSSVLPERSALDGSGLEVAVLWEPLHMVGGDYFWLEEIDGLGILLVADCTGHGVPGAFLTLIVATALDRLIHERGLRDPAAILEALDGMVRTRLRQDGRGAESDDGLDCGLCIWEPGASEIRFAGAGTALTAIDGAAVTRIRGSKRGLGYPQRPGERFVVEESRLRVTPGMTLYLMTDGITDQMGGAGPARRLLGHRGVTEILGNHQAAPLSEQVTILEAALADYRGGESRRDDMTLVAFRPRAT
ncbi:serine/threonine protein phosphatase [Methylobacterium sp. Leaf104]|uniref:SpoIIE family protein phosphatase n=1 Tax=Methylobacterium TaxID=407 RepID=UPI0006F5D991|nr:MULTISPECIES: SpoIIE family protein phosphatase [Methylobacterium]KQP42539.1 serine/threonine protein phosphatase [Methylobacterium sp. Leaf104]MCI9878918.1 SpoIIE family protein phosphatase [Methylobacterium goesingense]